MSYSGEFQIYEDIIQEMSLVYQHDKRPWMIGFSGGKDSTLLCCLVMEMLRRLPASKRNKKVYRLGDSVKVKCSRVDIDNREVFFDILDSEQNLEEIVPSEETASIIAEVKKEFGTKPEEIENTETTTEPEEEFNE